MSNLLTKSNSMRSSMPSHRKRKTKILGFGFNNADYVVDPGKSSGIGVDHAYHTWMRMLIRCYSESFLKKNPTYRGVTVCSSWSEFMNFRSWWADNVVDGWEIDKDLLYPGNRIYGPETCIFVPPWLNRFLIGSEAARGNLPIGVFYHKRDRKYRAQLSMGDSKQKTLGSFKTPEEAYHAWVTAKINMAISLKPKMDEIDHRIFENVIAIIKSKV